MVGYFGKIFKRFDKKVEPSLDTSQEEKEPLKEILKVDPLVEYIKILGVRLAEVEVRLDGLQGLLSAVPKGSKERKVTSLGRMVAGGFQKQGRPHKKEPQTGQPTL